MPGDVYSVWKGASARLQQVLNPDTYDRWIAGIVPLELTDSACRLGVSNDMFCDWLHNHYRDVIASAVREASGRDCAIVFESGHEPRFPEFRAASPKSRHTTDAATRDEQPVPSARYNPRYSFETFVVGENNKFAHAAAGAVAQAPGQAYNPLFIYGGTGLGKSHLLQAVAQDLLKRKKRARIECLSSEEFANLYVEAVSTNSLPRFRQNFRNADLLLIDDVQFFTGKERFQEEFFHTFNALYNSHKQIVLASDRPPHEINGLEKRLVSRFECGLIAEVQAPDFETRLAILRRKQADNAVKLDDRTLALVASRIKSNIRSLEGALVRLVSYASVTRQEITCEVAEKILLQAFEKEGDLSAVSMDRIQKLVAEHYDVRLADMSGKSRQASIAFPRQVAMYLCRRRTECSSPEIGEAFARNHATVLHAAKTVAGDMEKDPALRQTVSVLERKIKGN